MLTDLIHRLRSLLRRRAIEHDLHDELRFHQDQLLERYVVDGLTHGEARRRARLDVGGFDQIQEEHRDARGVRLFEELVKDTRAAVLRVPRQRMLSAVALFTLAVGIGANTAVFSVANAVLLRPLPIRHEARAVRVNMVYGSLSVSAATLPQFNVLRERDDVFEVVAAHRLDFVNITGAGRSEQVPVARVTASFFRLFDAPITLGRAFRDEEDTPGAGSFALISHGLWQSRFGGAPDIVGRSVRLGDQPHTILGVVGGGFDTEQFDQAPAVWVPFQVSHDTQDIGGEFCTISGRLAERVSRVDGNARLQHAADDYRTRYPQRTAPRSGFLLVPMRDAMVGDVSTSLAMLGGAVAIVLLVACVNLANLLLMSGVGRQRELALRAALGASRSRVVRGLMVEAMVLAGLGGTAGLLLGVWGARLLVTLLPAANPYILGTIAGRVPRLGSAGSFVVVDWRVAFFALAVTLFTGLAFGVMPSFHAVGARMLGPLKQSGVSTGGRGAQRVQSLLVGCEVALALTLCIGALLLVRTSQSIRAIDPGFVPQGVITMRMSVTATPFDTREGIQRLMRNGTERLEAIPGVRRASSSCCVPLETVWQLPFRLVSSATPTGGGLVGWTFVSPGYFDTLGIPIMRGRDFTVSDTSGAPGVVIINQAMARQYWPMDDPLGQSIVVGRGVRPEYDDDPVRRIVAIVGDIRDTDLTEPARPAMYVPASQVPDGVTRLNVKLLPLTWLVKTSLPPRAVLAQVEDQLRQASGGLPVSRVRAMDEVAGESIARRTFNATLMAVFSLVALVLAAIGIYGVLSFFVLQKTPEIGIRMALGAGRARILRDVVGDGLVIIAIGMAGGLAMAVVFSRVLASFLFGVTASDPTAFVVASILVGIVGVVAVIVPSIRAATVDAGTALRCE